MKPSSPDSLAIAHRWAIGISCVASAMAAIGGIDELVPTPSSLPPWGVLLGIIALLIGLAAILVFKAAWVHQQWLLTFIITLPTAALAIWGALQTAGSLYSESPFEMSALLEFILPTLTGGLVGMLVATFLVGMTRYGWEALHITETSVPVAVPTSSTPPPTSPSVPKVDSPPTKPVTPSIPKTPSLPTNSTPPAPDVTPITIAIVGMLMLGAIGLFYRLTSRQDNRD